MVSCRADGTTEFCFDGPEEEGVFLVGDFNGWSERANPMRRTSDHHWEVGLKLEAGQYRFLYRVGPQWYIDADSPDVPNPWGTEYSVVSIP